MELRTSSMTCKERILGWVPAPTEYYALPHARGRPFQESAYRNHSFKNKEKTEAPNACHKHPKEWRGAPSPSIPGGEPSWTSGPCFVRLGGIPSRLLLPEGDPFRNLGAFLLNGRSAIPNDVGRRAFPRAYINPYRQHGCRPARNRRPRGMKHLYGTSIRKKKLHRTN